MQLGLRYGCANGQVAYHVSYVKHHVGFRIDHRSSQHESFFLPADELPQKALADPIFVGYRKLEAIFEAVRMQVAPTAPSRRGAVFCFVAENVATVFRDRSRTGGYVYVVRIDPMVPCFVGDMAWRDIAANIIEGKRARGHTPSVEEIAAEYWRATRFTGGYSKLEVVVGGAITVEQRVDA